MNNLRNFKNYYCLLKYVSTSTLKGVVRPLVEANKVSGEIVAPFERGLDVSCKSLKGRSKFLLLL